MLSKITQDQADKYELLSSMFDAILVEMKEFSKKKQDEPLNKLKVKMINKILEQIKNEIVLNEPTTQFLELLDDETLPTNSDAVLVLAQYRTSMDQFKEKYQKYDSSEHGRVWILKNK